MGATNLEVFVLFQGHGINWFEARGIKVRLLERAYCVARYLNVGKGLTKGYLLLQEAAGGSSH